MTVERILSREEIQELISAVHQGTIQVDAEIAGSGAAPRVDLLQTSAAGPRRFANLDIIFDAFAQNYSISLTNCLQSAVSVKRKAIDTQTIEAFLQAFNGRGSIGLLRLEPLRWGGLISFDEQLSFFLVENLLGGAGDERLTVPDRPLTSIERHVLRRALGDACPDLAKAFRPATALEPSLLKVESDPRMINIVPPKAELMVARFVVHVGSLSGEMVLAIPHASLEPLREKLREGVAPLTSNRDALWRPHVTAELAEMEAVLAVQVGSVLLQVRDILNFQVGDVLELGCDPNAPLQVAVEGKVKFTAQAGVRNGRKSVRITSRINNGVQHEHRA